MLDFKGFIGGKIFSFFCLEGLLKTKNPAF